MGQTDILASIRVPQGLASIQEIHGPGDLSGNYPFIVHIQDVHALPEAQAKIEKIIRLLRRRYGFSLLLLEGAQTRLDPKLFHFFNDPRKNLKMADYLIENGELSGPERFLIREESADNKAMKVRAEGIEDENLYRDNLASFKRVFASREESDWFLQKMEARAEKLSTHIWPSSLRRFAQTWKSFHCGKTDFLNFLKALRRSAKNELNLDLRDPKNQLKYPYLVRIFTLDAMSLALDAEKFSEEKKKLLKYFRNAKLKDSLTKDFERLVRPSRNARRANKDLRGLFEEIYQELPVNFSFKKYPQIALWGGTLILREELRSAEIMTEAEDIADKIFSREIQGAEGEELFALWKDLVLLRRLFSLELVRGEYRDLLSRKESVEPVGILKRIKQLEEGARKFDFPENDLKEAEIQKLFHQAIEFYRGAERREKKMGENIFRLMKAAGTAKAIVVTGGFHSEGLKDAVEAGGGGYLQISPVLENEMNHRPNYLRSILGGEAEENHLKNPAYLIPRQAQMNLGANLPARDAWIDLAYRAAGQSQSVRAATRGLVQLGQAAGQDLPSQAAARSLIQQVQAASLGSEPEAFAAGPIARVYTAYDKLIRAKTAPEKLKQLRIILPHLLSLKEQGYNWMVDEMRRWSESEMQAVLEKLKSDQHDELHALAVAAQLIAPPMPEVLPSAPLSVAPAQPDPLKQKVLILALQTGPAEFQYYRAHDGRHIVTMGLKGLRGILEKLSGEKTVAHQARQVIEEIARQFKDGNLEFLGLRHGSIEESDFVDDLEWLANDENIAVESASILLNRYYPYFLRPTLVAGTNEYVDLLHERIVRTTEAAHEERFHAGADAFKKLVRDFAAASSSQGREKAIQKIMEEFGPSRRRGVEIRVPRSGDIFMFLLDDKIVVINLPKRQSEGRVWVEVFLGTEGVEKDNLVFRVYPFTEKGVIASGHAIWRGMWNAERKSFLQSYGKGWRWMRVKTLGRRYVPEVFPELTAENYSVEEASLLSYVPRSLVEDFIKRGFLKLTSDRISREDLGYLQAASLKVRAREYLTSSAAETSGMDETTIHRRIKYFKSIDEKYYRREQVLNYSVYFLSWQAVLALALEKEFRILTKDEAAPLLGTTPRNADDLKNHLSPDLPGGSSLWKLIDGKRFYLDKGVRALAAILARRLSEIPEGYIPLKDFLKSLQGQGVPVDFKSGLRIVRESGMPHVDFMQEHPLFRLQERVYVPSAAGKQYKQWARKKYNRALTMRDIVSEGLYGVRDVASVLGISPQQAGTIVREQKRVSADLRYLGTDGRSMQNHKVYFVPGRDLLAEYTRRQGIAAQTTPGAQSLGTENLSGRPFKAEDHRWSRNHFFSPHPEIQLEDIARAGALLRQSREAVGEGRLSDIAQGRFPAPLIHSDRLDGMMHELTDLEKKYYLLYLPYLPEGSFKPYVTADVLDHFERIFKDNPSALKKIRRIVAESTGNQGKAVAAVVNKLKALYPEYAEPLQAVIFVPFAANTEKVRAMQDLGATVIRHKFTDAELEEYLKSPRFARKEMEVRAENEGRILKDYTEASMRVDEDLAAHPESVYYIRHGSRMGIAGYANIGFEALDQWFRYMAPELGVASTKIVSSVNLADFETFVRNEPFFSKVGFWAPAGSGGLESGLVQVKQLNRLIHVFGTQVPGVDPLFVSLQQDEMVSKVDFQFDDEAVRHVDGIAATPERLTFEILRQMLDGLTRVPYQDNDLMTRLVWGLNLEYLNREGRRLLEIEPASVLPLTGMIHHGGLLKAEHVIIPVTGRVTDWDLKQEILTIPYRDAYQIIKFRRGVTGASLGQEDFYLPITLMFRVRHWAEQGKILLDGSRHLSPFAVLQGQNTLQNVMANNEFDPVYFNLLKAWLFVSHGLETKPFANITDFGQDELRQRHENFEREVQRLLIALLVCRDGQIAYSRVLQGDLKPIDTPSKDLVIAGARRLKNSELIQPSEANGSLDDLLTRFAPFPSALTYGEILPGILSREFEGIRSGFETLFKSIVPYFKDSAQAAEAAAARTEDHVRILNHVLLIDQNLYLYERDIRTAHDYALSAAIADKALFATIQQVSSHPQLSDIVNSFYRYRAYLQPHMVYRNVSFARDAAFTFLEQLALDIAGSIREIRIAEVEGSLEPALIGPQGSLTRALEAVKDMRDRVRPADSKVRGLSLGDETPADERIAKLEELFEADRELRRKAAALITQARQLNRRLDSRVLHQAINTWVSELQLSGHLSALALNDFRQAVKTTRSWVFLKGRQSKKLRSFSDLLEEIREDKRRFVDLMADIERISAGNPPLISFEGLRNREKRRLITLHVLEIVAGLKAAEDALPRNFFNLYGRLEELSRQTSFVAKKTGTI